MDVLEKQAPSSSSHQMKNYLWEERSPIPSVPWRHGEAIPPLRHLVLDFLLICYPSVFKNKTRLFKKQGNGYLSQNVELYLSKRSNTSMLKKNLSTKRKQKQKNLFKATTNPGCCLEQERKPLSAMIFECESV